jgi:hypothetical protein
MRELRAVSSRAVITPTSFVNEYDWGDFKGDPEKWMDKYFDAFLYFANWGTRRLMLRFPKHLFDAACSREYFAGDSCLVRTSGDHIILSFMSEVEDDDWMDADDWLASMIPLRSEIMNGDLRCLYLAWLLCVQNGEVDEDEEEPSVPANLNDLRASQRSFTDFFDINGDLIKVAARESAEASEDNIKELRSWVRGLPEKEKDVYLMRILDGEPQMGAELRIEFNRLTSQRNMTKNRKRARTAGELLAAAAAFSKERKRRAAEKAEAERLRQERKIAAARGKYLSGLVAKENQIWSKIETLISTKQPARYDEAVKLLVDLRDLAQRRGKNDRFVSRCKELCQKHGKKTNLLRKIQRELQLQIDSGFLFRM